MTVTKPLHELSIAEAGRALRAGTVSSVALTQHALARTQMSGFTGMLSAELRGGYREAERFISSLRLATYAASLGGHETLVVHPSAMWGGYMTPDERRARGLSDSLVRISVGLEDERDLIADFTRALGS